MRCWSLHAWDIYIHDAVAQVFSHRFLNECDAPSDRAADAAAAIHAVKEYVVCLLTCAVSMGAVMGSLVGATIGFIGGGFQILRYVPRRADAVPDPVLGVRWRRSPST